MNKSQLIDTLAARFEGNRKAAAHALESVLDTITREVARGEKVAITGFGSFEKQIKQAGYARNPATGERVRTKKRAVPKFRAGEGAEAIEDSFDIDDYTRWRLLEGLDDIGITLGHEAEIGAYETTRPAWKPVTIH